MWSEWGGDFGKKEKSINYQFTFSTSSTLKHGSTHIAYEISVNSVELERDHAYCTCRCYALSSRDMEKKVFAINYSCIWDMKNLMQLLVFKILIRQQNFSINYKFYHFLNIKKKIWFMTLTSSSFYSLDKQANHHPHVFV